MRVQVVHHQHHLLCVRILLRQQPLDLVRPVFLRAAFLRIRIPPRAQWLRKQENATGSIPDIFVVKPLRFPRLDLDPASCVAEKLQRLFVHAHYRTRCVIRPAIHVKHVFHACDERGVLLWRYAPTLLQVRLEFVFFKALLTVIWDTDSK